MYRPSLILTTAFALAATPANSQAGLLGFDVSAGLDKGTMEFLKAYPPSVRKEFVAAVDLSLDRVDQSVDVFFAKTNELLTKAQDTTRCMTQQVGQVPADWLRNAADIDKNVAEELNDDLEDLRDEVDWKTTPDQFRRLYADFDAKASKADCLTASGDLLKPEILRFRKQARESYILWARLEGQCSASQDCFGLVYSNLQANIVAALPQDKAMINADVRFARIVPPPRKAIWFSWFTPYTWESYQTVLVDMLRINDELALVAHAREEQGRVALAAYTQAIGKVQKDIADAQALTQQSSSDKKAAACNIGYSVSASLNGVSSKLAAVEPYAALSESQLAEQRQVISTVASQAKTLREMKNSEVANTGTFCGPRFINPPTNPALFIFR